MSTLKELLADVPPPVSIDAGELAESVRRAGRVLMVLNDDPTVTQSVADLPVVTAWDVEDFRWAFAQDRPAVYVMTNSRSLDPADAGGSTTRSPRQHWPPRRTWVCRSSW